MLDNWINSSVSKSYLQNELKKKHSCFISPSSLNSNHTTSKVAIIGYGNDIQSIREAFYQLNFSSWNNIQVTDLGDIRNNDSSLMTAAFQELIIQGIFPIVIDPNSNVSISIANALKAAEIPNNQGIVSPKTTRNSRSFYLLDQLLSEKKVDRLSIIGFQKHYANPRNQNIPNVDFAGLMSLGKLRDNMSEVEPILRDLTSLNFDTSVIRASDSQGFQNQISIGLFSEEACRILHYAGASMKLKSIHISGFEFKKDNAAAAELVASLIWYAINGRKNAEIHPNSTESMNKYIVELEELGSKIKFWKNQNSEKWWVEIPSSKDKLTPCSETEYKMACNNKISDRLFHLLSNR